MKTGYILYIVRDPKFFRFLLRNVQTLTGHNYFVTSKQDVKEIFERPRIFSGVNVFVRERPRTRGRSANDAAPAYTDQLRYKALRVTLITATVLKSPKGVKV